MKSWTRAGVLLATVVGLCIAAWTFGAAGWRDVVAVAAHMGAGGFAVVCLFSLGVFVVLGAAWTAAAGEPARRVGIFAWTRLVREATSDLLPFSQIGGIVVSIQTLTALGLPKARANASFLIDLTTEMASQLIFTLFGLALMATILMGDGAASLRPVILGGTGGLIGLIVLALLGQRALASFGRKLATRFLPGSAETMTDIERELVALYGRRDAVVLAFLLNLVAWTMSGSLAWLVLRLIGMPVSIWTALSLESLIFTLRSVAFAIPGGIGVQEVAYSLIGPLFGLSPEAALALALVKRARDLTLALPTLIAWQYFELRALVRERSRNGRQSRIVEPR